MRLDPSGRDQIAAAIGSLGSLFTAAALVGIRGDVQNSDVAVVLGAWVVYAAVAGGRGAAVVTAVVAAISFDFFFTRPYGLLKIADHHDTVTTVLLVAGGLIAGELAIRIKRIRARRRGVTYSASAGSTSR